MAFFDSLAILLNTKIIVYVNKVIVIYLVLILSYEHNRNCLSKESSVLSSNACFERMKSSFMHTCLYLKLNSGQSSLSFNKSFTSLHFIPDRSGEIYTITTLFINEYGHRTCLTEVPSNISNKSIWTF